MFINFTKEPFEFPDFVSLLEVLKWESGEKKTSTDGGSEHEGRGEKLKRHNLDEDFFHFFENNK